MRLSRSCNRLASPDVIFGGAVGDFMERTAPSDLIRRMEDGAWTFAGSADVHVRAIGFLPSERACGRMLSNSSRALR